MSALRSAVHATLNSLHHLAVAAAVALGETASRIVLALLGPPALAILWPPVFAVVGFGLAAPTVRAALPDDVAAPRGDVPTLPTLVAAAVLGHLAALVCGAAGFLLLDTPIRAALYWLEYGDTLGIPVQIGGAILGVAVGTLLAWTLPGVGVGLQPPARVDGWAVADRSDDSLVLELVGARPVFRAVQGFAPDRVTNVSVARIRTAIDRESRTVERIEVRFAATVTAGETTDHIRLRVDHTFQVGIDVERPAALGPPQPGELVWKLLVY